MWLLKFWVYGDLACLLAFFALVVEDGAPFLPWHD